LRRIPSFAGAILVLLCAAHLAPVHAQSPESDPALGYWVNRGGWTIEAAPCDEGLCGTVVGIGGRRADSQRFDEHNPDPNLRTRPLCGIEIFGSFESKGTPGEWEGGWIYNPRDGKTYRSNLKLGDGDTLEVRGFVLTPMFGRTVILVRGEEPDAPCEASEAYDTRDASTG
jgi:uncharacterized protein (DUF2147 family)